MTALSGVDSFEPFFPKVSVVTASVGCVIEIARTRRSSSAPAALFFERWCDIETHPEWAPSMEYFRLSEPFGIGARGVLKAVGGEEAPFRVTAVGPGFVYADTTELGEVELTVHHEAVDGVDGTQVELSAWLVGSGEEEWARRMSAEVQGSLERDLAALAALLER
ncbi:hypothetical protein [Agromyces sp. Leaf222]|uniref:hypothetical protein n=1 Tax=Agromyces sp. Leaf222 TaxID=1735688 RepID=UPI0006F68818|nr:hypothetical protein [Agromyces sp. Leaf222]KQM83924.1 hypothetical protein ASE68_12530 [Agromyces sp. Leaf222]